MVDYSSICYMVGYVASIVVPNEFYELLVEVARRRGKSVEEVVVESIVKDLDPKTRVEVYAT